MIRIAYSVDKESHQRDDLDSVRCPVCGKRIADVSSAEGVVTFRVKCTRCGRYFYAEVADMKN